MNVNTTVFDGVVSVCDQRPPLEIAHSLKPFAEADFSTPTPQPLKKRQRWTPWGDSTNRQGLASYRMVDNGGGSTQWRFGPNPDNGFPARFTLAGEVESAEAGAYLWSLADLMTLLLVFFVLLYSSSINRPEIAAQVPEPERPTVASSAAIHSDLLPEVQPVESISMEETVARNPEPPAAKCQMTDAEDPVEPGNDERFEGQLQQ